MPPLRFNLRLPSLRPFTRPASTTSTSSSSSPNDPKWQGRQPYEHITNQTGEPNIQASASGSGKADRVSANAGGESSQAASEADQGNHNERAKKDHPEAPGPVIGMNDERGGSGH